MSKQSCSDYRFSWLQSIMLFLHIETQQQTTGISRWCFLSSPASICGGQTNKIYATRTLLWAFLRTFFRTLLLVVIIIYTVLTCTPSTIETYVEKKEEEGLQGPRTGDRTGVDKRTVANWGRQQKTCKGRRKEAKRREEEVRRGRDWREDDLLRIQV